MATSASHIAAEVAKMRKTRRRFVNAPSPSTKYAAARATLVCHRVGRNFVIRQTKRSARSGSWVANRKEDAESRACAKCDPGQENGAAFADQERAENDPDREDDAVEEALG